MYKCVCVCALVVVAAGAEVAVAACAGGVLPANGSRFPGIWSAAFQGGTFERLAQRCSGDFSQCQQNKYIAQLPGLPDKVWPMCKHVLPTD